MKNLNLILLLAATLFVTSCGDDDPDGGGDGLVGTWKADSFSADVTSEVSLVGLPAEVTQVNIEASEMDYTLVLNDSPSTFTTSGSYDIAGSIQASGIMQDFADSYDNVSGSGTYRVEGDSLYTTGAFFDFEVNGIPTAQSQGEALAIITELTDTRMVVQQNTTMEETSTFGFTTTTTVISSSTWTKQ